MKTMTRGVTPFAVKSINDGERTFEGLASTWDLDLGGDVIHKGAFARTLGRWRQGGKTLPLLDQHASMLNPTHSVTQHTLGKLVDAEERDDGLWARFQVAKTRAGDDLLALLHDGMVEGLSIGYAAINPERKDGVRHLREVRLDEISVVTFPMNPAASIDLTSVKSLVEAARAGKLDEEQEAEIRALPDDFKTYIRALLEDAPPAPATEPPADPQPKGLAPEDPQRLQMEERLRALTLASLAA